MCPLLNDKEVDDYSPVTFHLDGDGDDKKKQVAQQVRSQSTGGKKNNHKTSPTGSSTVQTTPQDSALELGQDTVQTEIKADAEDKILQEERTKGRMPASAKTEEDPDLTEQSENSIGRSSKLESFQFSCQVRFQRQGKLEKGLKTAQLVFGLLTLAALFLQFSALPTKTAWIIFVVFFVCQLIPNISLHVFKKSWTASAKEVVLTFATEEIQLLLPQELSKEFTFAQEPGTENTEPVWKDAKHLGLTLALDAVLDQTYHAKDRCTKVMLDVPAGERILTLEIPDSSLERQDRGRLEAVIFNRSGRALRAGND